jgi:colicin import membrane protein
LALLGWALVSFQATPPLKIPEAEAVEVALITADDLVRLTKGDRSSKNLKTQAAKETEDTPAKQEVKKAVVKTVPPPAASEPPPPDKPDDIADKIASLEPPKPAGPTPEELAAMKAAAEKEQADKAAAELALKNAAEEEQKKKAEAEKRRKEAEAKQRQAAEEKKKKLAAKREAERKKKLAEKRRREREARKFDSGKISALLNKIPDAKSPDAGSTDPNADQNLPRGAQAGAPEGRDTRLTASQASLLGAMMKREVARCWNINSGLAGIDRIVVDIEVKLRSDGRLQQPPKVISSGRGAIFQDAANNAMRALVQCEPYNLPKELYKGGWDHMVVTFDPQKMF